EPGDPETIAWPMDPLGSRRARVERAAARVRASEPRPTRYDADIEALLAERAARREAGQRIRLPHRVPASAFHRHVDDAPTAALNLRRPVPQQPHRRTRLGTRFHGWVEDRYSLAGSRATLIADTELDGTTLGAGGVAGGARAGIHNRRGEPSDEDE